MNISMKRFLLLSIFLLMLIVIIYLFLRVVDNEVTSTYADASYDLLSVTYERIKLIPLNEWKNLSQEEILRRLNATTNAYPGKKILVSVDSDDNNIIWYGNIKFLFSSNKLVAIK